MGLFKKKKAGETVKDIPSLPELPELPGALELPTLPSESIPNVPAGLPKIETQPIAQTLPSLPSSPIEQNFNQEAIKHEIRKPEPPKSVLMPSISQTPLKTIEPKRTLELSSPLRETRKQSQMTKKLEPVFIRLDKFQTTLETFEEIKLKIEEIEDLLSKTREIKQKEEQELADWEREIQMIKSRIDLIDRTIFNKLD